MKSDKMPCAAVVLGLDSHGLAAARALADGGVHVYAAEQDLDLPGARSNRVRGIFKVKSFGPADLMESLRAIRAKLSHYPRVALLANNDRQVEAIGKSIDEVQGLFDVAWGHCATTVLELQRKDALQAASSRAGLNYPRSITFTEKVRARDAAAFRFPVIIKPVRPLSSFKTLLAHDVDDLQSLLDLHAKDLPILGQEYIAGDDQQIHFGVLVMDHGRVVHGVTGRKLMSHPPAQGQAIIAETTDNTEVLELTRRFFAPTSLSGPAALELKRDPCGEWWVIEPTIGRTEFNVQLCISSGFNVPLMEYQIACGLPIAQPEPLRQSVWYDTERDPAAWLRLSWRDRTLTPHGKTAVFPYLGFKDRRPFYRAARNTVCRLWGRVVSGSGSS